jgi:hypothetical protein
MLDLIEERTSVRSLDLDTGEVWPDAGIEKPALGFGSKQR